MRWTIKNKLLSLSGVGILATFVTGISGYWGSQQLHTGLDAVVETSAALRSHMEADMMHDALRGDVLAALVAVSQEEQTTATNDLKEHARHFREVLQENATRSLSAEIHQALKEVQPVLEEYIHSAETLVQLAQKDSAAAKEKLANFYLAFSSLENEMEKLSDLIEASTQEAQRSESQTVSNVQRSIEITGVLALGLLCGVALWISRGITLPLQQTVTVLRDLAEGEGDLTKRLSIASRDEIGDLASGFNVFMDKLHDIITQAREAVLHVNSGAQQLSAAAGQLSNGAQSQAASLQETAASLEEITGAVKQNADNARQANQLAHSSRDTANGGTQVVTATVESMRAINDSSKRIAEIITVIDEIAFQTNLLALNAAVEAARAGEQGRGFAVVAAEVRNLAQRSAGAAKEIKTLIRDSVQKVDEGSQLVDASGETLREIVNSVKHVTDIIAEITAASQEQSTGVDEVNKAVSQMDHVTQQNAAQTEELSSTAQLLAEQARQLQSLVGRFKLRHETRPSPLLSAARVPVSMKNASVPVTVGSASRTASSLDSEFAEF